MPYKDECRPGTIAKVYSPSDRSQAWKRQNPVRTLLQSVQATGSSEQFQKYERYASTIANIESMKARTEAAISQALDERSAVRADLEYARSLTRITQATSVTEAPFEPTVSQFRQAEDALAGVIALQEVRLETEDRASAFRGEAKLVPAQE